MHIKYNFSDFIENQATLTSFSNDIKCMNIHIENADKQEIYSGN